MDSSTKSWSLLNLLLIFITLGFAAMSTNPVFSMPSWLPLLFFIAAGGIAVWLVVYLIVNWSSAKRLRQRRKDIAHKLAELVLAGDSIKDKFKDKGYNGNAVAEAAAWSESVRDYFLSNPAELGDARVLSARPRQADWYVYGHFDPLNQQGIQDDKTYAFRHISIESDKLLDLIEEFLR